MKPLGFTLLILLLCLFLPGCQRADENSVSFYYSRDPQQYQYFEENAVIDREYRDLTGHRKDLRYMTGLYLAGPMEEGLIPPFSKSTRLLSVQQDGGAITIELSDHTSIMTDSEFSLACACLTLTCLDFTECEEVTVVSGERSVTMTADSILLSDTLLQQETTGG